MSTTTEPTFEHATGCAAQRPLEVTQHERVTTRRCVDCGKHAAYTLAGEPIHKPTTTGALTGAPGIFDGITMEETR